MSAQASQAQVKPNPKCEPCEKPFSSKQAVTRHVKNIHNGIVSLKNLFTTPKTLTNQKRLFTSEPNISTQGNSEGQVNDPKVVSEGIYIWGVCDDWFKNKEDRANHLSNANDNATADNESIDS